MSRPLSTIGPDVFCRSGPTAVEVSIVNRLWKVHEELHALPETKGGGAKPSNAGLLDLAVPDCYWDCLLTLQRELKLHCIQSVAESK